MGTLRSAVYYFVRYCDSYPWLGTKVRWSPTIVFDCADLSAWLRRQQEADLARCRVGAAINRTESRITFALFFLLDWDGRLLEAMEASQEEW